MESNGGSPQIKIKHVFNRSGILKYTQLYNVNLFLLHGALLFTHIVFYVLISLLTT